MNLVIGSNMVIIVCTAGSHTSLLVLLAPARNLVMGAAFISAGWMFSAKEDQPRRHLQIRITLLKLWTRRSQPSRHSARMIRLQHIDVEEESRLRSFCVTTRRICIDELLVIFWAWTFAEALDFCRSLDLNYTIEVVDSQEPAIQAKHRRIEHVGTRTNEHKTERRDMTLFTFVTLSCGTSW